MAWETRFARQRGIRRGRAPPLYCSAGAAGSVFGCTMFLFLPSTGVLVAAGVGKRCGLYQTSIAGDSVRGSFLSAGTEKNQGFDRADGHDRGPSLLRQTEFGVRLGLVMERNTLGADGWGTCSGSLRLYCFAAFGCKGTELAGAGAVALLRQLAVVSGRIWRAARLGL